MYKVGITGGIGSGKSTVANIFIKLGIPVFFSDIEAAKLISRNKKIIGKIHKKLGDEVFFAGIIDRKKLAKIVFPDRKKLDTLNSIIHPAVRNEFKKWVKKQKNIPYIIQEAAIIIETGAYKNLDFVILVTAPEKLRIERVMKRDNISEHAVRARMKNQLGDARKKKYSDAVIVTDNKKLLLPQILKIHKKLLRYIS